MDSRTKIIRDYVLGDGRLSELVTPGCNSAYESGHAIVQSKWVEHKARIFSDLGFTVSLFDYEQDGYLSRRFYTEHSIELRSLRQRWYEENTGLSEYRYIKNYINLFADAVFDEESLAILFLDNGCASMRKSWTDYRYNRRIETEPYVHDFRISSCYQNGQILADVCARLGIYAKARCAYTRNSEIRIGQKESKEILQKIVHSFCLKNNLIDVFAYKYDHPICLSRAERLSGKTSHYEAIRKGRYNSLNSTNNCEKESGEGNPKRFPRLKLAGSSK